ncbi:MAG: hypothetical protein OEV35_02845 [Gallionellaceae bacterium]|nr:hypothetical protein [Gallionellaceae bacterium]
MSLQDTRIASNEKHDKANILSMLVPAHESGRHYPGRVAAGRYGQRSIQPSEIRAMQRQRGEDPCFCTDKRYSCSDLCDLRKECLKLRAVWLR